MASGGIDPRRHKFWLYVEFLKGNVQKTYRQQYYLFDFTYAFDSIHRGKIGQIYSPAAY